MAVPLCLPPGLLRDLCGAKTPFILLFPSKNWKVDVQVGERMLYAFYLYLHELSSESAHIESDKSLSCLGKVRAPHPNPFTLLWGITNVRVYECLKSWLYILHQCIVRLPVWSMQGEWTIMGQSLRYIEMDWPERVHSVCAQMSLCRLS